MTQEAYIALYQRYQSGMATPEEIELLLSYRDKFDIGKFNDETSLPDQEMIKARIYASIEKRMEHERKPRLLGRTTWWAVAASILLLTFTVRYFLTQRTSPIVKLAKTVAPIKPGTNKATLILSNGSRVDLNQTANGHIAQAGKTLVSKINNGQLVYTKNSTNADKPAEVAYNTIITPRGGQYEIVLPDGTKVWLNAASSLKYPTAFTGKERHVELNGEAYFEVTKNKEMPFMVTAGKVNVKVLGTHFNISAYDDDPASKTTLLEGAVVLTNGAKQVMLAPGQQAVALNDGVGVELKQVNVEDAIAWKKGYFSFRKENIKSAMRKVARWYDVDVQFDGALSNKTLGGSVSRTKDIKDILSYLELTGIAHFSIKERRIIVKAD